MQGVQTKSPSVVENCGKPGVCFAGDLPHQILMDKIYLAVFWSYIMHKTYVRESNQSVAQRCTSKDEKCYKIE